VDNGRDFVAALEDAAMERDRIGGTGLSWIFFAAGALALATQVYLLRELIVALQGDETAIGLGLGAWLAGIALGGAAGRRLGKGRPGRWAGVGLALLAVAGPGATILARLGRLVLAPPSGELLSLGPEVLLAVVALAPPGFLIGATFATLAASAAQAGWPAGKGIARLYVLESLGSLVAGVAVTFLLIPFVSPLSGACAAAGVCLLAALPASRSRAVSGRLAHPVLALLLIAGSLPPVASPLEEATVRKRFEGLVPGVPLVDWGDTPYQHVSIAGDSTRHLYLGGQYAGSFPDPVEDESLAHQWASLAPAPTRTLVLGGGYPGYLPYLLRHPVDKIDWVSIDHGALGLVRRYLPLGDVELLDHHRLNLVEADPRRFLAEGADRYGLILVLEPAPVTLLLARYSTAEFYALCGRRLSPDGVLVIPFESPPNVLSGETAALAGSVYGALRRTFPTVLAHLAPGGYLIAGHDPGPVTLDPEVLSRRYRERGIRSDVFAPELFPALLSPDRIAEQGAALREAARDVSASEDDRPVSFIHALTLRQRLAGSVLAPVLARAAGAPRSVLLTIAMLPSLAVVIWFAVRRRGKDILAGAAVHAIIVAGACGMCWSLLVLFSFQTTVGALYGQIGWLAALFMLGLASGGWLLAGAAEKPHGEARRRLVVVAACATGYALLVPVALIVLPRSATGSNVVAALGHASLLLGAGAVTGALFPTAAGAMLAAGRDVADTAGTLEWADHLGASFAALVSAVLLVPALGLSGTGWLLLGLQAIALTGLALARD
jgi:spermidine synthase